MAKCPQSIWNLLQVAFSYSVVQLTEDILATDVYGLKQTGVSDEKSYSERWELLPVWIMPQE